LSLVLLVGAVLFVRSLQKLLSVDPGFRPEGIISVDVDISIAKYPKEQRQTVFQQLQDRLATQPGIVSIAQIGMTPLSGSGWNQTVRSDVAPNTGKESFFNRFGPGYLRTMGIGLISGRDFDDRDRLGGLKVAVVNEAFAKRFFENVNPVGHTFRIEADAGQ